ncbi:serine/threonine protein kinase [Mycobacterium lentiflavum]|uniref:non-specific serine/threonine protein kinase n=1 Tax=Mycobacterium lentiflavum TaxID=141349 RepID=A0A0E4CMJ6_MYCLN|nr:serine/threonine-protein kinase [Mycobacterium lentiflavum]CQD10603.1 serine/threonine protein kinase [Mycobacterium lentiflavum]
MALASGAVFAGYTVARRLGSGVTGDVYLVQDPRSARWQALKVLSPALSSDRQFRRDFLSESPTVTSLHHQHIVAVHDRGDHDEQLWIAMDYVEGSNAAQLLKDRFPAVWPVGEVLAIITAVADALDYAQARGVLHRDVKPANILLTNPADGEQRILLSDFGVARPLGEHAGVVGSHVPVGTVGYAAPEQLMGADVDRRADQYALAATAFHLLTGAPPTEYLSPSAALRELLEGAPRKLSDQRPELAQLDRVFSRALAIRPADRFASCREFADAANALFVAQRGDRGAEAVLVLDYPALGWPEGRVVEDPEGTEPARTVASDASDPEAPAGLPTRRRPRKIVVGAAAILLLVGLFAFGLYIGRKMESTAARAASAPTSAPAPAAVPPPTTASGPPTALDGTYRLDAQRSKETFDYTPSPQPPDVTTWWALRSSCTPSYCSAAAVLLDNNDHTQLANDGGRPVIFQFTDGQWQARPETVPLACVGPTGIAKSQTTVQTLALRPNPQGDLVGEMDLVVQTNECGQRGSVVRVPATLARTADTPSGVYVPDPVSVPEPTGPLTPAPAVPGATKPTGKPGG